MRHQNGETDALAQHGGDGGAGDAHFEREDEQRIQHHVQQPAGDDAEHGEESLAFGTQIGIHHERRRHQRSADQDPAGVLTREGQNGLRRSEQPHKRIQPDQPAGGDQQAERERGEKRRRGGCSGLVVFPFAQTPRGDAAGSHAEHETDRLNDRHQRIDHADGAGGAGADTGHEERVGHVVKGSDQHAADGWHGQAENQRPQRRLSHLDELLLGGIGEVVHGRSGLLKRSR